MADLLDIAPSTAVEVVKIDGAAHYGARPARRMPSHPLWRAFPNHWNVAWWSGAAISGRELIEQFGAAIGPIIAAGCGHLGDEKYEQHAEPALLLEDQLKLIRQSSD